MRLEEIIQATGAEASGSDEGVAINGVRVDSRQVRPGDLFVCLPGERADGHDFAEDALQRGAVAILASRSLPGVRDRVPVLRVEDCLVALGDLGARWRELFEGTVIAVTGSAGKTSLKELLASVLSRRAPTAKNFKNWNNRLGVPLSLLEFSGTERYWVLEAGVNRTGEMDELARILRPDAAVIHNVGPVHLEGMGSREGVAREKTKLAEAVRESGLILASADYPLLTAALPERPDARTVRFSCGNAEARYRGEYLGPSGDKGLYRLDLDGTVLEVASGLRGAYQLENILAAATAARELGCGAEDIEDGLADAELPEHRSQVIRVGEWILIDDCYNANPVSVRCALEGARELAGEGPLIAFLGDMFELGDEAGAAHCEMGRDAARQGVDHLLYSGGFLREVERGYREAGGRSGPRPVETDEQLQAFCRDIRASAGTVLLKGSRGCRLERFLQVLQRELGT